MRSPLRRAGELTRPFVIFHGEDDPVVPVEGSIVFAATARDAGADVELHLFEGEGHGFRRADSIVASVEAAESFFGQVFGFPTPGVPRLPIENPDAVRPV